MVPGIMSNFTITRREPSVGCCCAAVGRTKTHGGPTALPGICRRQHLRGRWHSQRSSSIWLLRELLESPTSSATDHGTRGRSSPGSRASKRRRWTDCNYDCLASTCQSQRFADCGVMRSSVEPQRGIGYPNGPSRTERSLIGRSTTGDNLQDRYRDRRIGHPVTFLPLLQSNPG